jgi:hypothetical protein
MEGLPPSVTKIKLDVNSAESVQAGVAKIVEQAGQIGELNPRTKADQLASDQLVSSASRS